MRRHAIGLVIATSALGACKGKSSDAIQSLLCGDGHAKGKMTMGLNLGFLKGILGLGGGQNLADDGVSNDAVKGFLNDTLKKGGISESALNISTVESVGDDDKDHVRFMSLGGTFGAGFGVATSLVKEGLQNALGLDGKGKAFDFLNESFSVAAADGVDEDDRHVFRGDADRPEASANAFDDANLADVDMGLLQEAQPFHPKQWAYTQTDFAKAQAIFKEMRDAHLAASPDDKEVIVAVLDTGVDLDHPDLKDVLVPANLHLDTTNSGSGVQDENGHGTHCAGIIAAQRKGEKSPLGVANVIDNSGVRIMPIKVLGKSGGGGFQEIEKGIRFAMKNGAKVISMSLGGGMEFQKMGGAEALENGVVKEAIAAGVIVIIAAGNESCPLGGECKDKGGLLPKTFKEYTVLPCAFNASICIGATDANETLASYSNYASKKAGASYRTKVDVNAPGTEIYATWPRALNPEGYRSISGTSMATPYVAGIAALVKSVKPDTTQEGFRALIKASQAYPQDIKDKSEEGRLDLYTVAKNLKDGVATNVEPPAPKPVEAPTSSTSGGKLEGLSSLWGAVCKI